MYTEYKKNILILAKPKLFIFTSLEICGLFKAQTHMNYAHKQKALS